MAPTFVLEYDGRIGAGDGRRRTGHHERPEEGHRRQGQEGLLRPGPRRARSDGVGCGRATAASREALKTDNFEVAKLTLAQEGKVPDDATLIVVAGPQDRPSSCRARSPARVSQARRQAADPRSAGQGRRSRSDEPHRARAGVGRRRRQRHRHRRERARPAHRDGTDDAGRHARRHPITENFSVMTAFPLARSVTPVEGGTDGRTAAESSGDEPAELGGERRERAVRDGPARAEPR